MATHSRVLGWKIPWTEESMAGYSPWGCKESDTTEHAHILHNGGRELYFGWQGCSRSYLWFVMIQRLFFEERFPSKLRTSVHLTLNTSAY